MVDDKELPLVHVGTIADLLLDQAVSPRRVGSRFRAAHDGERGCTAADGHRRELPDGAAAGPVGPVHQGTFQHLPVGDVPRALPDPAGSVR